MERDDLLKRIRSERARLDEVLSRIPDERMLDHPGDRAWTGKDELAHLAAWHRVALNRFAGNLPSDEEMNLTTDEINERFFKRGRDTPLGDVRSDFTSTYDRLCEAIEGLTDADLHREWDARDPEHRTFAQEVAGNTFEHYLGHLPAFNALADREHAR